MKSPKARSAGFYLGLGASILFLVVAVTLWVRGLHLGWSLERRITIELALLCSLLVILLLLKYLELVVRWVASLEVLSSFRSTLGSADKVSPADFAPNSSMADSRHDSLLSQLRERHGRRWRHRERWILVTGPKPLVQRLSPALASTGFVLTAESVLLFVADKLDAHDQEWLKQIRRMRRRRPIDAIVALASSDAISDGDTSLTPENLAPQLARINRALRWAAPAYLLDVARLEGADHTTGQVNAQDASEIVGLLWTGERISENGVKASMTMLANTLSDAGVARLSEDPHQRTVATLAQHVTHKCDTLCTLISQTAASSFWRHSVHGIFFAPLAPASTVSDQTTSGIAHPKLWQTIAQHSRKLHGRRVGFSPSGTVAWLVTGAMFIWILGVNLSGLHNRATIRSVSDALTQWNQAPDRGQQMLALNSLDRQIDTFEVRERNGAPWSTRFGLNRDSAILDAVWPGYVHAAQVLLVTPVRQALEARLMRLASLSDAEIADSGNVQANVAYDTLKAYLMLATPARANSAFLTPQLMATNEPVRPDNADVSAGTWNDLRGQTLAFLASHLGTSRGGVSLATPADQSLVASTRQTIVSVRGIQNSTDAIYEKIIDEAQAKYPPITLTSLLGDTSSRGLFSTTQTVPGVFTRAAFDERISRAIDEASARQDVGADWVLSDSTSNQGDTSALKAELQQRYFDDYARAWEQFLNSLRWQSASTLTGTVDQLLLLGDPQRSPMVALMNAITYQAGTGVTSQSLAADLLGRAQQLVGHEQDPTKRGPTTTAPLASAFGPILRLTGSDLVNAGNGRAGSHTNRTSPLTDAGDLSLSRYLERVTAMRLKLQQMVASNDPDAMSRVAAQAVLQGKTSEIADSRDYASRLAASLGGQWSGFGDVLQAPLDQAWQVVVQPAAANLNDLWRTAIVADWNKAFGGRYPFADSDNDASLPEMARFMRADNGVIAQFAATQLAGVIERQGDRWVATQGANQGGLSVDPAFLDGLNRLTRVAIVLFPSGDARMRYELRGVPTPGITDVRFVLSDKHFHYFNQREAWEPFEWPGQTLENVTHVEWQTAQGGLRSALDAQGRFGLIRLLERAQVTQQDSARYVLSWVPDQTAGRPLRVQLRSDVGAGPLEVLTLRHFKLPSRIFTTGAGRPFAQPKHDRRASIDTINAQTLASTRQGTRKGTPVEVRVE
ncbi:ImcF-related family protein [Pandoraea sp. NPDC090278]|uniref:ImcF-related family protein n=1 Tax=Pandoraea sp. NPDC090278 TaxID=3364391 RepID=UPI00383AB881